MRAIGYFRSRGDQLPIRELQEALNEYCDLKLHQPVKVFGDRAPAEGERYGEFRRMLEYMGESASGFLVVVPDASHLGDDLESAARAVVQLQRAGAKVTCSDGELPDPLQNAFQTLGVKGVSRTRSDRIKASMRARAIEGKGLGKPPYGYRNGRDGPLEVLREEAAVVELIYRLYTKDGLGLRLIARHLNELGLPTRRGGRWNMVTLRDILRNPTYTGTSTRFGLRVPKSHEPIIPADVFRAVQDRTVARRPSVSRSGAEPFVLSGMAYCGYCGNKMMGVTRRQTWKRKDGHRARGVYRYYQCQSRNNQSICGYHTWRAPLLEEEVLSQLRLALKARADRLEGDISSTREREIQAIWAARVANAEHRFVRAMRRAAKGELGIAELGHYLDQIDIVRRQASSPRTDADGSKTLSAWDSLPVPERQSFLMGHVARIVVRDDEVEVVV